MTCFTPSTSMAYCRTDRQLRSVWTTTLETFRWTKSSPGNRPTISLAGTRLSEQPIQRYLGDCWVESFSKKRESRVRISLAHCRLLSKRFCSVSMAINGHKIRVKAVDRARGPRSAVTEAREGQQSEAD